MQVTVMRADTLVDNVTGVSKPMSEVLSGGGSYTLPAATTTEIGGVKKLESQADSTAADVAGLLSDFNALLAKLRTAGLM